MRENLIWFTGAPGSKWSGSANILQAIPHLNFNITDRNADREYTHPGTTELSKGIMHTGAYFGPGHGLGEQFHLLDTLTVDEVENEIVEKWQTTQGRILVKSHFFSNQLDYIADTWKDNVIIMILRPDHTCIQGWFGAGGWDIAYPDYRPFYKNGDRMKELIAEHNFNIKQFCNKHSLPFSKLNEQFLKDEFNWDYNSIEDATQRAWVERHLRHTESQNDVEIAIYNRHKL
jgi:hypothetical protein